MEEPKMDMLFGRYVIRPKIAKRVWDSSPYMGDFKPAMLVKKYTPLVIKSVVGLMILVLAVLYGDSWNSCISGMIAGSFILELVREIIYDWRRFIYALRSNKQSLQD